MKIESNKNWTTCLRLNTGDGSPRVFLLNSHFLGSVPYVFIIFFILSFFIVTFAFLHLLAGGTTLLKGDKTTGNILVFAGGLIALPPIPLLAVLPGIPFLTWILGATLCCVGAYKNGKEKGNINKSHHVIRITIAVLLTLGLAFV